MRSESVREQVQDDNKTRPAGRRPRQLSPALGGDEAGARLTWAFVVGLAAFTVVHRLVPRLLGLSGEAAFFWNLMPVGALGLFAGARLRSRYAVLVPLAAMLVSDLLLIRPLAALGLPSFYAVTPFVYLSYALCALVGRLVGGETSPMVLGGASLLASTQFFLVTNFAVWLLGDGALYPRTFAGLAECYVAAIPFFRNTLAGDLLFTGLFFGLYALVVRAAAYRDVRQPA
jgi:hypothetical protein